MNCSRSTKGESEESTRTVQTKISGAVDKWKADITKLRVKASGARADAQIEMNKQVKELDHAIEGAGTRFSELAGANEEAGQCVKKGMESAARDTASG